MIEWFLSDKYIKPATGSKLKGAAPAGLRHPVADANSAKEIHE